MGAISDVDAIAVLSHPARRTSAGNAHHRSSSVAIAILITVAIDEGRSVLVDSAVAVVVDAITRKDRLGVSRVGVGIVVVAIHLPARRRAWGRLRGAGAAMLGARTARRIAVPVLVHIAGDGHPFVDASVAFIVLVIADFDGDRRLRRRQG